MTGDSDRFDGEPDDEFDELETLAERGIFWSPRDAEKQHPHKLVVRAVRWETTTSKFDSKERDVIVATTRDGVTWKIACDNLDLAPLHTGEVKSGTSRSTASTSSTTTARCGPARCSPSNTPATAPTRTRPASR